MSCHRSEPSHATRLLLGTLAAAVLLTTPPTALAAPPSRPPRAQPSQPVLVDPHTPPRLDRVRPTAAVLRRRVVTVDVAQIAAIRSKDQRIRFPLFGDTTIEAVFENVVERAGDRATWSGSLAGPGGGSFTLVVNEHRVGARLASADGATYVLRYLGDGLHVVEEIDQTQHRPCGTKALATPLIDDLDAGPPAAAGPCDEGSTIDTLVVYTPAARDEAGGTEAILSVIDLAVATTNAAFGNSLIDARLRVVHIAELDYDETSAPSLDDHLHRLRAPTDGYMDEVHAIRDLYGADVVSLIVSSPGWGGGIAYLMSSLDPSVQTGVHNVVRLDAAIGGLTFAHELGHNLGCRHDRLNEDYPPPIFDYSYGYQEPSGLFRTIMAYPYGCQSGCARIEHFSNPEVTHLGEPTGVPAGEPDSADNTATINQTAPVKASYRCADCNLNGVPDTEDIASGASVDSNTNDIPDDCETQWLFVDATATSGGDGADWDNALSDLQDALDAAAAVAPTGMMTEIWVAAGTYRPDRGTGDRNDSFQVPPNVELYGGFAGGEVLRSGRDHAVNPTILSGDLDRNDAPGFQNIDDNSLRVLDATAGPVLVDGFTITGSNTEGIGGGLLLSRDTTIRHCLITANSANKGAGVAILSGSPDLIGCRIAGNRAIGASAAGAGLFHTDPGVGEPSLTNCLLIDNTAEIFGGAIVTANANLRLVNCSIGNNSAGIAGGGIGVSDGHLTAVNCVLWGNDDADGSVASSQLHLLSGTVDVSYSCVQGWTDVFGGNGNLGADPMLADASMRLRPSSPCIDAGDNAAVHAGVSMDLDESPRFVDHPDANDTGRGTAPIVDMGAYENHSQLLFVDADAPAGGSGVSWATALDDLQEAIDVAAALGPGNMTPEIWVAAGTYRPDRGTGDRDASFHLPSGTALYGGFAGGESTIDERDIVANPTVLSGDLNGDDQPGFVNIEDNSARIIDATAGPVVIDGVTITGSNGESDGVFGGGLEASGDAKIRNCTFMANAAVFGGAANVGSASVVDCVFIGNRARLPGGALLIGNGTSRVVNCIFLGNLTKHAQGGAVHNGGNSTLVDCVFSGNLAPEDSGGAVHNIGTARVVNCTMTGNSAETGGGIAVNGTEGELALENCILWGNDDLDGAGESSQIHVSNGAVEVDHSCIQGWTGALGGAGNIGSDPLLTDPDGTDDIIGTIDDDLTVMAGSPVIDAGDSDAVPSYVTTDLAGQPRFVDDLASPDTGNVGGASAVVDMGAYEFQGVTCAGDLDRDGKVGFADLTALLAAWGPCEVCPADMDGDDRVGFADLTELLAVWGACTTGG